MARGYEVSVGADGRAFNQALKKDIIKPTEEAAKALDEFAEAGADAGDDGARSVGKLEDALKDAERQTDKLDRSVRKLDGGFDKAKKGADELKDEANSTAREAAASFDGSAESIGEAFQEVAANAFGGFGPAGQAAGLAVAAGIGVGIAAFQGMEEQSEATKEAISENFREMAEDGIATWEGFEAQRQRLTEAYDQHEGEIKRIADLIGLNFEDVAAAWAGNEDAIKRVDNAYGDMVKELESNAGVQRDAAKATADGWARIKKPLDDTITGYDRAKEKAKQLDSQLENLDQQQRDRIQRNQQADQARYEGLAKRYGKPITAEVEFKANTKAVDAAMRRIDAWDPNKTVRVHVTETRHRI